jgi:hypothetical protein
MKYFLCIYQVIDIFNLSYIRIVIVFFFKWAAPASAWKRCIRSAFISFIQQRLARGLTMIIQAKAIKKGVKAPPN